MERRKRVFTFITFFVCIISLGLLAASLATHKWIISKPSRLFTLQSNISTLDSNSQSSENNGKFKGNIYFGLFHGTKILNYGFGNRTSPMWIKEELMKDPNLMPFALWLFTILSVAIAILFGIVSSIFAVINTVTTPIEMITGLRGLFLWNGFGALFCGSACLSWFVQYHNRLKNNVLTSEEIKYGWTSENRSWLGYSYFLVLISMGLFVLNILIVAIAIRRPTFKVKVRTIADKNPEGVIMLY